jgi:hypothetical protein
MKNALSMATDNIHYLIGLIVFLTTTFSGPSDVHAEGKTAPIMIQVMVGEMNIANSDDQIKANNFDILLLGASAQKAYGGSLLNYGIEIGGLFHWQSDIRSYVISSDESGGTVAGSLDINAFLFDYFFGAYLSVDPAKWMRFYLGAGPLLIFGSRTTENVNPFTEKKESVHDSGYGVGNYARLGVEFIFTDRVIFSVSARHTWTNLSLEGPTDKLDIEGWQYFGGLSFRYQNITSLIDPISSKVQIK